VWSSFDPVAAVGAPFAGRIVFPNPAAETGQEWFYLARASERLRR